MSRRARIAATLVAPLVAAALAVACARVVMPRPTPIDAERARTTIDILERGRSLYVSRCSSCHQPVAPSKVAPGAWPGEVREMSKRAHLDPGETELVIQYLVALSSR